MAGPDEVQARTMLVEMQERLRRDPYEALGVTGVATPSEVRSAFLALTKVFHPARFGRMDLEVQRLSNEVFLGLRAAHDALIKPSTKPGASRPSPSVSPGRLAPPISRPPLQSAAARPTAARPGITPVPQGTRPGIGDDVSRPRTQSPPPPTTTPGQPPASNQTRPSDRAIPSTPPSSTVRFSMPAPTRAPTPATPPTPTNVTQKLPQLAVTAEERELAAALELLVRAQWDAARANLNSLAARHPGVVRYRSLLAYARGREAQLARRIDEARVELEQALQIDPDLQLAKTALGELFTRRK